MENPLQSSFSSENPILRWCLTKEILDSTADDNQESGIAQKAVECEPSLDLHPLTPELSGDLSIVQQKSMVVSGTDEVPDCAHALQLQNEVEHKFNMHLSFSSTVTRKSGLSNASYLQIKRPPKSPRRISQQHSILGHSKKLPTFKDSFSNKAIFDTSVPFKKRLVENFITVHPNQEPCEDDPAPLQRNKEHQKIVISIPSNSSMKFYTEINSKICRKTCSSQNSVISQLLGPSVVLSSDPARVSVASISKTSISVSSSSLQKDSLFCQTRNIPLSDNEIMFGYPTNMGSVIVKDSNSVILNNQSDTNSVPLDLRVNKQTSSTVFNESSTEEEQRPYVENDTEKQPNPCDENEIDIIDLEKKNARTSIENETKKFSGVCCENASEKDFRATDKNGTERNDSLGFENYSESVSTECSETNNVQEPSPCDENMIETNYPEKDARSYIENDHEKYSRVQDKIASEKEFRVYDENETNKFSKLCNGNYCDIRATACRETTFNQESSVCDTSKNENHPKNRSSACSETSNDKNEKYCENRSTECNETNNEQEASEVDINDSEMEIRAFEETELWEAFEMDDEGMRELGNNIKGLEDIMEYLAGSDEACNQFSFVEIASLAKRRTKKRDSCNQRGQQYNLRSKVDLSRMIITRGQKRSGKSKLNDVFSGIGIVSKHSARTSNSRMVNTSSRSNKSSWKANAIKMEHKEAVSSQLNIIKSPGELTEDSSKHLLIRLQADEDTGEIDTKQIPEFCPACHELLCPSRFTISVHNFSLKTVCVGCGSTISVAFESVSDSCVETGRKCSRHKSNRKKEWGIV